MDIALTQIFQNFSMRMQLDHLAYHIKCLRECYSELPNLLFDQPQFLSCWLLDVLSLSKSLLILLILIQLFFKYSFDLVC